MPAIPEIIALLLEGLEWLFTTRLGMWIVSLFAFLGLSFTTQHFAVQPIIDELTSIAGGVSASGDFGERALNWLGVLNFDKALSMVFSALTTKYSLQAAKVFLTKKAT